MIRVSIKPKCHDENDLTISTIWTTRLGEAFRRVYARLAAGVSAHFKGTIVAMNQVDETYSLTVDLLGRIDRHVNLRVAALAHLGVAILLFAESDPETAEALAAVIEGPLSTN